MSKRDNAFNPSCGVVPTPLNTCATITGNLRFTVESADAESLVLFTDSALVAGDDDRVYVALREGQDQIAQRFVQGWADDSGAQPRVCNLRVIPVIVRDRPRRCRAGGVPS
jgi:hypothetical protein